MQASYRSGNFLRPNLHIDLYTKNYFEVVDKFFIEHLPTDTES